MNYKKLNKALLKSVLSVQTYTEQDEQMLDYIKAFAKKNRLPVKADEFGNLYITKGKAKTGYPCMVSHVDTVHKLLTDFVVFEHKDSLFAYTSDGCQQVGIGGDDKIGVYACLQALLDFDTLKVVFFRMEEGRCQGSSKADMKFFDDCNFVLQLDRRENGDFSFNGAGVELNSKEFRTEITHLLRRWKYKEVKTSMTDVVKLKQRGLGVCVTNMSCGYYYNHTDSEVVLMRDVDRAYCLASDIISEFGHIKFEHTYVRPVYTKVFNKTQRNKNRKMFDYQPATITNRNSSYIPYSKTMNEDDRSTEYNIFRKQAGDLLPHLYLFKGRPMKYNDYMYLPNERMMYDLIGNEYVTDEKILKEIYQHFTILDCGKEFVFSWELYDWVDKSKTMWLTNHVSWMLNNNLDKWEQLKGRGALRRAQFLNPDYKTKGLGTQLHSHTAA